MSLEFAGVDVIAFDRGSILTGTRCVSIQFSIAFQ